MSYKSLTVSNILSLLTFLSFLFTKNSSDKFGVKTFAKIFLYFSILTISPILNSGFLSLIYLLESIYVLDFTSTGFVLIVA